MSQSFGPPHAYGMGKRARLGKLYSVAPRASSWATAAATATTPTSLAGTLAAARAHPRAVATATVAKVMAASVMMTHGSAAVTSSKQGGPSLQRHGSHTSTASNPPQPTWSVPSMYLCSEAPMNAEELCEKYGGSPALPAKWPAQSDAWRRRDSSAFAALHADAGGLLDSDDETGALTSACDSPVGSWDPAAVAAQRQADRERALAGVKRFFRCVVGYRRSSMNARMLTAGCGHVIYE